MYAIKMAADGSVNTVTPQENNGSILGWLQDQVGGFVEIINPRIRLPFEYKLVVNEDGKIMRLPHNERASTHMHRSYGPNFIVGDCIIVKTEIDENGFYEYLTLSAEEVTQLMRVIG